ncbi:hypothetical protein ACS8FD_07165 [Psychrobacter sp. 1U2]|uniref:hypothetical protein n=1 Tax=Psychrobacter sp. 1U2 TaxID=3453577 RepID=UPI003F46DC21
MSILIQAGHCSSYSDVIMQKLYERGLGQPFDSYTHNMTAQQVADKLYQIVSRAGILAAHNKLADNVMVDLLLSNLDIKNWGWSAEKNLFAMDLWQQLESEARFILVFDHPSYLLGESISADITVDTIDQVMSEWVEYHQKMLETLEAHEDKAILIEGSCAVDNISNLGKQVESISSDLYLKKHWQVFKDATDPTSNNDTDAVNQSGAAIDYINNEILKKYPEVIKLFNTLLNKAAIKSSEPIYRTKQAELSRLITISKELSKQKESIYYLTKKQIFEEELKKIDSGKQEKGKYQLFRNYCLDLNNIENKYSTKDNMKVEYELLVKENTLLITQVHQLQELLTRKHTENKVLKSESSISNANTIEDKVERESQYGAADRVKKDLPYRIGNKIVKAKNPIGIVKLPLILFKEYNDFHKTKLDLKNLPNIDVYEDWEEAERVKEHLSYRVGKVLVDSLNSPKRIYRLPRDLSQQIISFYRINKKS